LRNGCLIGQAGGDNPSDLESVLRISASSIYQSCKLFGLKGREPRKVRKKDRFQGLVGNDTYFHWFNRPAKAHAHKIKKISNKKYYEVIAGDVLYRSPVGFSGFVPEKVCPVSTHPADTE
jgi:hypothetical protein